MNSSQFTNSSFPDALPTGTTLRSGDFVLEGVLGQGGSGITYRAADRGLHRAAAIKEFFPQGCRRMGNAVAAVGGSDEFAAARERFLAEARILAQFKHPNIVNVYTIFEENDSAYMVMEFLSGADLQEMVETRGALPEREALGIIEQVAGALEVVHRAGMLHLDIKPDNVILDESTPGAPRAVLLDFGLTRKLETAAGYATTRLDTFARFGTAGYAPLEQYSRTAKTGVYTDIYALAATLYVLLTGQTPPEATDRAAGAALPDARSFNRAVSTPVAGALAIGLAMEPQARPQSVPAFLDLLRAPDSAHQSTPVAPAPSTPVPTRAPQTAPRRQHDEEEDEEEDNDEPDTPEEAVEELMDQLFGAGRQSNPRRHDPFGRDPFSRPAPRRLPGPFGVPQPMRRSPQNGPFGNDPFGQAPRVQFSSCGCAPGCLIAGFSLLFFILNILGALLQG